METQVMLCAGRLPNPYKLIGEPPIRTRSLKNGLLFTISFDQLGHGFFFIGCFDQLNNMVRLGIVIHIDHKAVGKG